MSKLTEIESVVGKLRRGLHLASIEEQLLRTSAADLLVSLGASHVWTPCAESLPDSDTTVMTFAPDSVEPIWPGYHDGVEWIDMLGGPMNDAPVTHWMQFPEPPEGHTVELVDKSKITAELVPAADFGLLHGYGFDGITPCGLDTATGTVSWTAGYKAEERITCPDCLKALSPAPSSLARALGKGVEG